MKSAKIWSPFWFAPSCIRTEYGDLPGKYGPEKTSHFDTFHVVHCDTNIHEYAMTTVRPPWIRRWPPLCVCVCVWVCVCVCVLCVCVLPSTVKALFVWIKWDTREHIHDVMLKTLNSYADSLHRYFRMQNLAFLLAALSCSWTRSGQSHDLTSARLAFRTWDLHSRFSRRRLPYALPRKSICFHTCHSREG